MPSETLNFQRERKANNTQDMPLKRRLTDKEAVKGRDECHQLAGF